MTRVSARRIDLRVMRGGDSVSIRISVIRLTHCMQITAGKEVQDGAFMTADMKDTARTILGRVLQSESGSAAQPL